MHFFGDFLPCHSCEGRNPVLCLVPKFAAHFNPAAVIPALCRQIPAYAGMTAWGRENLTAAVSGEFSSC
ncbi:MAG: hypothetical protein HAW59_01630 [Betaproteobacteria bacterium]|nr:hypothetical protein [Betaproteobacteria bacterium]